MVDWIVAKATFSMFTGDERDGETPPITVENFWLERDRHGAKALRERLSRLSYTELLTDARAARDYFKARPSELAQFAELAKREELRQRQAERGRRSRLQPAILGAARHYRQIAKKSAKEAWLAIKRKPYQTDDGSVVIIAKGGKEEMLVRSRRGQQKRSGIGFGSWQDRYWPKADSRSTR
jgi:hypothetical protein